MCASLALLMAACVDTAGSSAREDGGTDAQVATPCPAEWEDLRVSEPCVGDTSCWYPTELMCFGEEDDGNCVESGYRATCSNGSWETHHKHVDAPPSYEESEQAQSIRQESESQESESQESESQQPESQEPESLDAGICEGGACDGDPQEAGAHDVASDDAGRNEAGVREAG